MRTMTSRSETTRLRAATLAWCAAAVTLSACGGGDGSNDSSPETPTAFEREAAASATAGNSGACAAIRPFHWSIGDASGVRAQGQVGTDAPTAQTVMAIASASKLIYGAYVAEQRGGHLTGEDVKMLNFTSGYTEFDICLAGQTVGECQSNHGPVIRNGSYIAEHDGYFFYSGGHMQKHATLMGLGSDDNAALAQHIMAGLNGALQLSYTQPQPPGGVQTSAAEYGRFLQRVVAGQLRIHGLLGSHAVCATPGLCDSAIESPVPPDRLFHYSIGHWVETDAPEGDGAFSSAGAFGFYPWIDASKQWWGVIARQADAGGENGAGMQSLRCGREIRKAWLSGVAR